MSRAEKGLKWYGVMDNYLGQLADIKKEYGAPIVYPGDIFHHWQSVPELVNFAIKHLPSGYAIPGQHDLPLHNYEDVRKSAYWTLVEAGVLVDLKPGQSLQLTSNKSDRLCVTGFPYGFDIKPPSYHNGNLIHLAAVHQYCWVQGRKYPGAKKSKYVMSHAYRLNQAGYDVAVFGDNHQPFRFIIRKKDWKLSHILNGGVFIPAKSDEMNIKPAVGLLRSNRRIYKRFLDNSKDQWVEGIEKFKGIEELHLKELDDFMDMLKADKEESDPLDFEEYVKNMMDSTDCSPELRAAILEALE